MHPRFQALLLRYSRLADPEERGQLEREIWAEYGCERAVLVVDMSGFSSLTQRHGIVHYLSMVRRMQITAEPIVHGHEGVILKFEADNAFAMFPEVDAALAAAFELNRAFEAANVETPDELDIRISCGIDAGPILVVEQKDFFGDAVNRASKLGEDLAAPGEVLLSATAAGRLRDPSRWQLAEISFSVSGLSLPACRAKPAE
ncbi:adenylate/guanylate cyclase domain-containing protein [Pseudomarimonas salicorniae]|uniref:Adenylate/guanylate cyclase domain-containing protein n=1 Tax=Pseudomarimonas salicorniae TaxID=2933270 RepID=A0ABT0GI91_9GAMM|nr:adenylate/guanylate cyclase domain-containing protein [Lysobacter sp. CAU 1642]MCK7594148.1 adenylate/guanylate cyclase domain-containing protein [Lysobacter sp. CAU 1642]